MTMLAEKTGAGIAGKTVKTWVVSTNRQPEKPGVYKVYNRRNGKTTETEMVWNGTYWMTTNGGKVVDVVQWLEEAPVADAAGTAVTALADGERGLTLADYEARIHLYREQIGTGYIGIGRTLNEAKEAGVVPHGEWEEWVTRTTGLNTRQAQRCMQAAREIRDGSALARLEMSKALMLLASGLSEEEQEQAAGKAADEGQSVRELREEIQRLKDAAQTERADSGQIIKQLKQKIVEESGASAEIRIQLRQAKAERDQLAGQLEATQAAYRQRMDEAEEEAYRRGMRDRSETAEQDIRKEFQGKIDHINSERRQAEERIRSLETELGIARNEGSTRWDEGYRAAQNEITGLKNEANKQRQYAEALRRNQDDLLAAAEEAEKRAADAEAELAKLRAGGPEGAEPAWKVLRTAADKFLADCEMLPIWDAPGVIRGEAQITPILERLEQWILVMRDTLAGVVASEGAVL